MIIVNLFVCVVISEYDDPQGHAAQESNSNKNIQIYIIQ